MEIVRCNTPSETVGKAVSDALRRHSDKQILLLLSGGSALSMLEYVDRGVLGPHVTITTLDERFSSDPAINNFAQIEVTDFYADACRCGVQAIVTRVEATDSLEESGKCFEKSLREWRMKNPDGVILTTMGVGEDGHTAGIFPGTHDVDFSSDAWVVSYVVPKTVNSHQERITVSYTFLRTQVAEVFLYATGKKKQIVIEKIENFCSVEQMPVCIVNQLPAVTFITDFQ